MEKSLLGMGLYYNAAEKFIDDNVTLGRGDKVAIYYKEQQVTYKQLQQMVNKVGNSLREIGIQCENRVLLVCYDNPQFIASFFGAIKIGAVPIPVNTVMQPSDYEYFLNNSRSKVVIIHEDIWNAICHLRDRFIYLEHVIVISDSPNHIENVIRFQTWLDEASDYLNPAYTTYDDQAFWLYSSGTTGKPKGIIHLQHDMEYCLNSYAKKVLRIDENDITFSASKLFFAYGLGNGAYFPLGIGASTVLMAERPTPDQVIETIEKYKPTVFFGVPTLFGAMIEFAERSEKRYDMSSLRACISAGEVLPAAFMRKWKKLFNLDILDGIGSSEALHIFLSNQIGDIREGSSGKVVPGYEVKIVNENGVILPPNEVGDLVIKGDSVAHCYWNLHEENKGKFYGEWLYTGDKYYKDEDGYHWYCGRSDDIMKVGGIWTSPLEIENALLEHAAVMDIAVVGIENENRLIQPKAFIVLKQGVTGDDTLVAELKQYVKQKLAPYKYPRIIEFIDKIPRTASGKIQKFKLKQDSFED